MIVNIYGNRVSGLTRGNGCFSSCGFIWQLKLNYKHMKRRLWVFLCMSFVVLSMYGQNTIRGTVLDESKQPIPGANVLIKGSNRGTITDTDGNFTLDEVSPSMVLSVSFIGMLTEEMTVGEQTSFEIQLIPDIMQFDQIVVIGYGTVKKKDLTGAVSSIKSEDLSMAPVANAVEAIQGRVAGLDITRSSGSADADMNILLRGNRSLQNESEPIYIIDGIQGSINNLNPRDIVSIDVLKDAASTAIYGAKGANGVIMITTKQAEAGKMQVDFNAYMSINGNPSFPKALKGQDWLDYLEEGYKATYGETPADRDALLTAWGLNASVLGEYIDDGKWVDWVDESLKNGIQYNTDLSIRAGNEKIQSGFSMGYNKTEGIYKNDYFHKLTLRENLNIQATPWIKTGIVTGLIYKNREARKSRINKAFSTIPLGDVYDEDGEINTYPIEGLTDVVSVIADDIGGTYKNNTKSLNITANPYIEITPFEGFSFKSNLGTTLSASRQGEYNSDHTYMMLIGSSTALSNATYETSLDYGYTWENILSYKKTLDQKHNIGVTLVSSYESSQSEEASSYSNDLLYEDYLYYNLDAGSNQSTSNAYEENKRLSFAGRLNYNYKGKYFITGSVRYDGVSQLADKWDMFPAGAVAWRISDENFMAGTDHWLNNLKLRAGYGVAGSYNIGAYSTTTEVTNGADYINLGSGQLTTTVPTQTISNDDLGWEKTYSLNLGLDFGLFNGKIDGSLEWYAQDTKDIIYDMDLPFSNGGYSPKQAYTMAANIGRMKNHGIEITINTRNIQTSHFQWNTTFTFARNKEEVTSIDLGSGVTTDDLIALDLYMGEPLSTFYGYKKKGIWQTGEATDAAVFGLEPGDVKVATDLVKVSDGVWQKTYTTDGGTDSVVTYTAESPYTVNSDDRRVLGHETPDWTAGLQNTFTYKGFDLSIFITARWGQTIEGDLFGYFDYGSINIPDNYDYWTEDNPTNDFPRPYLSSRNTAYSDPLGGNSLMYVDASYIKVKNITLGYTLPNSLTERIKLNNLRVYGTVYNSLIITKSDLLKGIDPESGASDSFPLYKQLVFGINASF